jgi:Flp pilus assembly protein protease CpaA
MRFFFWFFLVCFLVAALQDLKRREVDNWLNLFIFFSGFLYVVFNVFYYGELSFLINFAFLVFIMFGLAYLFYFSRVFAGGDCKLLFAATPLLVSFDFMTSLTNVLFFCLAVLIIGALYGAFWIFWLFFKDFKENKKDFSILIKKNYLVIIAMFAFVLLGVFERIFFTFFILSLFLLLVFFMSKSVEKNSLIREVKPFDLKEGDWIEKDIFVKGKKIKSTFDGLSLEDIEFLRKSKKLVRVKDGIPFAPVFLFAWIIFYFQGVFMEFLASVLG